MAFLLLNIYIVLFFVRPHEWLAYAAGNYNPPEVMDALVYVLGFACLFSIKRRWPHLIKATQNCLIIALLAAMVLSYMVNNFYGAEIKPVVAFGKVALLYLFIVIAVDTPKRMRIFLGVIVIAGIFLALQGILEGTRGYGFAGPAPAGEGVSEEIVELHQPILQEGQIRVKAFGVFADPNDLALILVVVLPFLVQWALNRANRGGFRLLALVGAILTLWAIYLTQSRGGWLALGVMGAAFIFLTLSRRAGSVMGVAMIAVMMLFAPGRLGSFEQRHERIAQWAEGNRMLKESPLFGKGMGMFVDYNDSNLVAHNSFVHCYAELGLLGYFFWLGLVVGTLWDLRAIRRAALEAPEAEDSAFYLNTSNVLMAAMTGFLAGAFFLSRSYVIPLFILIACGTALRLMRLQAHGETPGLFALRRLRTVGLLTLVSPIAIWIFIRMFA